jgi:CelD/BcsL family acetyltransferase involved in cellulose biosynthesis
MRTVQVVPARQLSAEHEAAWLTVQESNPHLDSAFYTPHLTRVVASVRNDVEVAVMREGSEAVGFFPYLRSRGGTARPIAGRLTEFHGPITRPDCVWDPRDLLRRAGLRAWYFDHLSASHSAYHPHSWNTVPSPYADLRDGFGAYESSLKHRGGTVAQVRRKERKLSREVGPLRFDMRTDDARAFEFLLKWKADQYERVGRLQIFNYPWTVQLLDAIRRSRSERFAGVLSALYAGSELAAVHLGLRTSQVLHIWFPAYSRALEQYSPGLILMLHLAHQAAASGISRIDFGPGEERYKQQFKSDDARLLVGGVDLRFGRETLKKGWYSLNQWIRRSRYREYLEVPINATRRYRQRLAFR